jgi:hypothetical protein
MGKDSFKRQNIWFWLIAISLMVVAMCVLALQLIELHRENDLKIFTKQRDILPNIEKVKYQRKA